MSLPSALPLPLSASGSAAAASPRRRWEFWRSPDGQPPWARPALLGIAAVPEPTLARVKQLVATGQLKFFLLGGAAGFGGPGRGGGGTATQVASWVESACAVVPAADYGATSGGSAGTLYACG